MTEEEALIWLNPILKTPVDPFVHQILENWLKEAENEYRNYCEEQAVLGYDIELFPIFLQNRLGRLNPIHQARGRLLVRDLGIETF